jgi:hypothetical protein
MTSGETRRGSPWETRYLGPAITRRERWGDGFPIPREYGIPLGGL